MWWTGEGRQQKASHKNQSEIWWAVINASQLPTKRKPHSALHVQAHILADQTPLDFLYALWVLALRIQAEIENLNMFRAAVKHLGHSSFLVVWPSK